MNAQTLPPEDSRVFILHAAGALGDGQTEKGCRETDQTPKRGAFPMPMLCLGSMDILEACPWGQGKGQGKYGFHIFHVVSKGKGGWTIP